MNWKCIVQTEFFFQITKKQQYAYVKASIYVYYMNWKCIIQIEFFFQITKKQRGPRWQGGNTLASHL